MGPRSAELEQRLDAFVAARARELGRPGHAAPRRSRVDVVFADELAARPPGERALLRAALESAAGESAWELARTTGRDPARAMRRALEGLLTRT
jgi:hypothetical protein